MIIELVLGPLDGLLWEVQDGETLVVVRSPVMTPQEFIEMGEDRPELFEFATMPIIEYAYLRARDRLSREGRQRFVYAGVRSE